MSEEADVVKVPPEVTEKVAAEMIGVTPGALRKARARGTGMPYVKRGHAVRYRLEDVKNYIKGTLTRPRAG